MEATGKDPSLIAELEHMCFELIDCCREVRSRINGLERTVSLITDDEYQYNVVLSKAGQIIERAKHYTGKGEVELWRTFRNGVTKMEN